MMSSSHPPSLFAPLPQLGPMASHMVSVNWSKFKQIQMVNGSTSEVESSPPLLHHHHHHHHHLHHNGSQVPQLTSMMMMNNGKSCTSSTNGNTSALTSAISGCNNSNNNNIIINNNLIRPVTSSAYLTSRQDHLSSTTTTSDGVSSIDSSSDSLSRSNSLSTLTESPIASPYTGGSLSMSQPQPQQQQPQQQQPHHQQPMISGSNSNSTTNNTTSNSNNTSSSANGNSTSTSSPVLPRSQSDINNPTVPTASTTTTTQPPPQAPSSSNPSNGDDQRCFHSPGEHSQQQENNNDLTMALQLVTSGMNRPSLHLNFAQVHNLHTQPSPTSQQPPPHPHQPHQQGQQSSGSSGSSAASLTSSPPHHSSHLSPMPHLPLTHEPLGSQFNCNSSSISSSISTSNQATAAVVHCSSSTPSSPCTSSPINCISNATVAPPHTPSLLDLPRPFLNIVEQPINRIRYRYKSEKGSHGGLAGERNSQSKRTFPTVKLENYHRNPKNIIIKAYLVTNESSHKSHVHKLMGRNCNEDGVCITPLGENYTAIFQNLGILFVGKKEVPEILYQRKLEEIRMIRALHEQIFHMSESEKCKLREEAEKEAKDMNLNCVRIAFEAYDCSHDISYPIAGPVYSRAVANQKSPDSGELKIVRMDKVMGSVRGNEEIFLLCEKVNKKEIKVRFFQIDTSGRHTWYAFGSFAESDVHHQVAIVFRTPQYHTLDISEPVEVYVQLYRERDGECSEPKSFTFYPDHSKRLRKYSPVEGYHLTQLQQHPHHQTSPGPILSKTDQGITSPDHLSQMQLLQSQANLNGGPNNSSVNCSPRESSNSMHIKQESINENGHGPSGGDDGGCVNSSVNVNVNLNINGHHHPHHGHPHPHSHSHHQHQHQQHNAHHGTQHPHQQHPHHQQSLDEHSNHSSPLYIVSSTSTNSIAPQHCTSNGTESLFF